MLWFLLACGGDGLVSSPVPSEAPPLETVSTALSADTSSATVEATAATATTGDTGPRIPLIDEALAGRCDPSETLGEPGPAPAPGAVPDLHRVTLPTGRCNDGTPAVAYVRAATDPDHLDDWVVFLEGGGRCDFGEDCAVRWCGEDLQDARKMSSLWAGEGTLGKGLSSRSTFNAFAGWNQVQVPYCTSDEWSGTAADVVLETQDGTPYRLHFEGALVVDGLLAALEAGATSDDGVESLAPLGGDGQLVLAGASAGSTGVMTHLDAWAAHLAPMDVRGLLDANSGPDLPDMAPVYAATLEANLVRNLAEVSQGMYGALTDADCASGPEPWKCGLSAHLQRNHLDTPFFLAFDLRDPALSGLYEKISGIPRDPFAEGAAMHLDAVAASQAQPGVFGSVCRNHMSVTQDRWFHQQTLPFEGGRLSLHDAVVRWLDGASIALVDDPYQSQTVCP